MSQVDPRLERYMELIVRVGLNLQPGQTLAIGGGSGVPLEIAETVRTLARTAYDLGAGSVNIEWNDGPSQRLWVDRASEAALERVSPAQIQRAQELIDEHAAFASLFTSDPDLFAGVDPARMGRVMKARAIASKPVSQQISSNKVPWTVAAVPTARWASKVFPDKGPEAALAALWDHVFHATRADMPDPVGAWRAHVATLTARMETMNQARFTQLRYHGPGTDLLLPLPERHRWVGGGATDSRGVFFVPNLPTEEVFSLPLKTGAQGTVQGTLPVLLGGTLVEGARFRFEAGRIVEYSARAGVEALRNLIETDDGSKYLGEVALVTSDSPTFATFPLYNALYDENVSCHLAIGNAYPFCVEGSENMSPEELEAAGANSSASHWDFMVGSDALEIDGQTADGRWLPVIRGGRWLLS